MFDSVARVGAAATLAAAEVNQRALIELEVRRLEIATQWADLHPGAAVDPAGLPGRERDDADPEAAERAADQAARERFVRLGRDSEHGLRTIWAKVTAGDALWGEALVARLAEILKRDGDRDAVDIRRSKAFGILISQPAEALRLLHTHQDDDEPEQSRSRRSQVGALSRSKAPRMTATGPRLTAPPPMTVTLMPFDKLRARRMGRGRYSSSRRRSTRPGPGPARSSMCTSARRRSAPGGGWPGWRRSVRCC